MKQFIIEEVKPVVELPQVIEGSNPPVIEVSNPPVVERVLTPAEENKIGAEIIAELNEQAEEEMPVIDNKTGINIYYHIAQQYWEQGITAKRLGDVERAYIMFMKYTVFILQHLPSHMSYNLSRFDNDKISARSKCNKVLKDLESLQAAIIADRKKGTWKYF